MFPYFTSPAPRPTTWLRSGRGGWPRREILAFPKKAELRTPTPNLGSTVNLALMQLATVKEEHVNWHKFTNWVWLVNFLGQCYFFRCDFVNHQQRQRQALSKTNDDEHDDHLMAIFPIILRRINMMMALMTKSTTTMMIIPQSPFHQWHRLACKSPPPPAHLPARHTLAHIIQDQDNLYFIHSLNKRKK